MRTTLNEIRHKCNDRGEPVAGNNNIIRVPGEFAYFTFHVEKLSLMQGLIIDHSLQDLWKKSRHKIPFHGRQQHSAKKVEWMHPECASQLRCTCKHLHNNSEMLLPPKCVLIRGNVVFLN